MSECRNLVRILVLTIIYRRTNIALRKILASNYGEPGKGGDLPASGAVPATVHPVVSGPNMRGDWRMASEPPAGMYGPGQRGTRPRHKVSHSVPLSEITPPSCSSGRGGSRQSDRCGKLWETAHDRNAVSGTDYNPGGSPRK